MVTRTPLSPILKGVALLFCAGSITLVPPRAAARSDPRLHPTTRVMETRAAARPVVGTTDGITVGTLALSANFNTLSVRLPYTGDDNKNATVLTRYWRSSQSISSADTAVALLRDASIPRFTGVIFWLDEGTAYHVRIDVTDPNGGSATVEDSITTRTALGHATGTVVWISPTGSDGNAGTFASPKATVGAAVSALGGPGQVRALPGIYYTPVYLSPSGNSGAYYSLVGAGDPDSVIFDASDPAYLHTTWTAYGGGSQINNIWYMRRASTDSLWLVVAGNDQRLHRKSCVTQLIRFADNPNFPSQGFCQSGDTVLVRLEGGADPNATTMHIPARQQGIRIAGAYWRAESLTTRFSNDKGFFLGAYNDSQATNAVLRNVRVQTSAAESYLINIGTNGVLMDACLANDGRIDAWNYWAAKARSEETAVGIVSVGQNVVVRNCTVQGMDNGISILGDNSDLHHTTVQRINDDALEFDLSDGVNVAAWGNYVYAANHGFSPNPVYKGPVYMIYNVFNSCDQAGLKMGGGNTATVYYYQNTFSSASPFLSSHSTGGTYSNQIFGNNSMIGNSTYVVGDGAGAGDGATCFFDSDVLYRTGGATYIVLWNGTNRTLSDLRSQLGWENHGMLAQPTYYDSSTGNFHPAVSSPVIDAGQRIQGINTPYLTRGGNRLYAGSAPDIGAFEYNFTTVAQPLDRPDVTAPATVANLSVTPHCTFLDVSWTAPGDDASIGTATAYDLRYSTSPITTTNFDSAPQVSTSSPQSPGSTETVQVDVGHCSGRYYFALKTADEVSNTSAMSNVPYGQTPCFDCEDAAIPKVVVLPFELSAPYPNPARDRLSVRYTVPTRMVKEPMDLGVFDTMGRRVRTLANRSAQPGSFSSTWDLRTDRNRPVPAGLYFLRLRAGSETRTRRVFVVP